MSKEEIRKQIDAIDSKILDLLTRRAELALEVSQFKKFLYDPKREAEIYTRLQKKNKGPLRKEHVTAVYREILSVCRSLQKQVSVAYLGPRGTFSHQGAVKKFGSSIIERPCGDISVVFDEVEKEIADFGVVPFENSTEGVISYTLDRFTASPVIICGEVYVDVDICLLSNAPDISHIRRIYSMAKPIEQCSEWLRANAAGIDIVQVASSALAAQRAARTTDSAAIASRLSADIYGLKVLEPRIEDIKNNRTRFYIISRQPTGRTGRDKTSVAFAVRHEAGSLYRALKPFEKYKINLTMMQARPSKQTNWEYAFFLDMQGHIDDKPIQSALRETAKETTVLKVLGSYPESPE